MKLQLESKDGVAILSIHKLEGLHDWEVLKVGLQKLLRDGKNRVVLDFHECTGIGADVIREIAIMDVFARELSGKIVLSSADDDFLSFVRRFSVPPVMPLFSSLDEALTAIDAEDSLDPLAEKKAAALLAVKEKEILALKELLKQQEPKELVALRGENAKLREELKEIRTLVDGWKDRLANPVNEEEWLKRVAGLESEIARLTEAN
jgi:hypothetical protein